MPSISATELQLLSFFEVEPTMLDSDVSWAYNQCRYQVHIGDASLVCAIAPAYKDIQIILKYDENLIYELDAKSVTDISYHQENNLESLLFTIAPGNTLRLQLRPKIALLHESRESA